MIITFNEAKSFLRIDDTNEDILINSLILMSEEYLKNATGQSFNSTDQLAKLFCLVLVSDWFENRTMTSTSQSRNTTSQPSEKIRHTIQSILLQLQYCYLPDEVV
jgi:uncharacterized phage protein (predicted DNA packaging)